MVNIYQVSDTRWSNALTTYNAIWMDVNNGAGGAAVGASGSRLLKLTNNTTEVFGVNLSGNIYCGTTGILGSPGYSFTAETNSGIYMSAAAGSVGIVLRGVYAIWAQGLTNGATSTSFGLASSGGANPDTILVRDGAANTLALRNGGTAASPVPQLLRIYNFYVGAADYERGELYWTSNIFVVGTGATGTGTVRQLLLAGGNLQFQTSGTNVWNFSSSGHLLTNSDNTYDIGASGATRPRSIYVGTGFINSTTGRFAWDSRSRITSPADGSILLQDNAAATFTSLQLGGTTSSFPAIKRSSANLIVRLADDSGNTNIEAASFYSSSYTFQMGGIGGVRAALTSTQAGVAQLNNGGAYCGLQFVAATYASLPTAASAGAGARFYITDGTTSTFYATVSGTGANAVCVFSDGTQYRVG